MGEPGEPQEESQFLEYRKFDPELEQFAQEIDVVASRFFPDAMLRFQRPKMWKIYNMVRDGKDFQRGDRFETSYCTTDEVFTAFAIRYIDDFIDTAVWPYYFSREEVSGKKPNDLEEIFNSFLIEALSVVRQRVPDMPNKILELPKLEMNLQMNPTQENFDNNVRNLIEFKSFDLHYMRKKFLGSGEDPYMHQVKACTDLFRDFNPKNLAKDTDFNIYRLIQDNDLDPQKLIDALLEIFQHEITEPYTFERYLDDQNHGVSLFPVIEGVVSDPSGRPQVQDLKYTLGCLYDIQRLREARKRD
ncbi:MAG: hypothetical protein ABID45_02170 [Patescibacteria group bacterium]